MMVYLGASQKKVSGTYRAEIRLCKSDGDESAKCSVQRNKAILNE